MKKRSRNKVSANDEKYYDTLPTYDPDRYGEDVATLIEKLRNPRIRNVGIIGPYGSGKSSLLYTMLESELLEERGQAEGRKLSRKRIKTISVFGWMKDHGGGNDGKAEQPPLSELENSIAQQLLYSVPPSKVPFSRLRRIGTKARYWLAAIAAILGILAIVFGSLSMEPNHFWSAMNAEKLSWLSSVIIAGGAAFLVGSCLLALSVIGLNRLSLGFKGATVELEGSGEKTSNFHFDDCLEELIYFFKKTGVNVVIFEDLDRILDYLAILADLKTLNGIINADNYIDEHGGVAFIYSAKIEDMPSSSKTVGAASNKPADHFEIQKAFDFSVSVRPVLNHYNILNRLEKDYGGEISTGVLLGLSDFVGDMRTYRAIRNAYIAIREISGAEYLEEKDRNCIFGLALYQVPDPEDYGLLVKYSSECKLIAAMRGRKDSQKANSIVNITGLDMSFYKYLVAFSKGFFDSPEDQAFYELIHEGGVEKSLFELRLKAPEKLFSYLTVEECKKESIINPHMIWAMVCGSVDNAKIEAVVSQSKKPEYSRAWLEAFKLYPNDLGKFFASPLCKEIAVIYGIIEGKYLQKRLDLFEALAKNKKAVGILEGHEEFSSIALSYDDPSVVIHALKEGLNGALPITIQNAVFPVVKEIHYPEEFKEHAEKASFKWTEENWMAVLQAVWPGRVYEKGHLLQNIWKTEDKELRKTILAPRCSSPSILKDLLSKDSVATVQKYIDARLSSDTFISEIALMVAGQKTYCLEPKHINNDDYLKWMKYGLFKADPEKLLSLYQAHTRRPYATEMTSLFVTLKENFSSAIPGLDNRHVQLIKDCIMDPASLSSEAVYNLTNFEWFSPLPYDKSLPEQAVVGLLQSGKIVIKPALILDWQHSTQITDLLLEKHSNEITAEMLKNDVELSFVMRWLKSVPDEKRQQAIEALQNVLYKDEADALDIIRPYLLKIAPDSPEHLSFSVIHSMASLEEKIRFVLEQPIKMNADQVLAWLERDDPQLAKQLRIRKEVRVRKDCQKRLMDYYLGVFGLSRRSSRNGWVIFDIQKG